MNTLIRQAVVNSHDEWSPLEEIIVGSAVGATFPRMDVSVQNFFQPSEEDLRKPITGAVAERVIAETEEDIDGFVRALEQGGVTVRRPQPLDHQREISSPYWTTTGLNALMPRDGIIVFGDQIIETPMVCRARHFETWAFKDIFIEYFKAGARWVVAPQPRLLDSLFDAVPGQSASISEEEPIFDAANMFRCGRDIFFNKSNTGNGLGITWLQRHLGSDYRVHTMTVSEDHVGTTVVPLRPGALLVNPERVKREDLHPLLQDWEVIWSPEPKPQSYGLGWPMASDWIGMNVLSLDERQVVVESSQVELMRLLERHGFTVIPVRYRHSRTFGGSFHCITLDVRRRGVLNDYFGQ